MRTKSEKPTQEESMIMQLKLVKLEEGVLNLIQCMNNHLGVDITLPTSKNKTLESILRRLNVAIAVFDTNDQTGALSASISRVENEESLNLSRMRQEKANPKAAQVPVHINHIDQSLTILTNMIIKELGVSLPPSPNTSNNMQPIDLLIQRVGDLTTIVDTAPRQPRP